MDTLTEKVTSLEPSIQVWALRGIINSLTSRICNSAKFQMYADRNLIRDTDEKMDEFTKRVTNALHQTDMDKRNSQDEFARDPGPDSVEAKLKEHGFEPRMSNKEQIELYTAARELAVDLWCSNSERGKRNKPMTDREMLELQSKDLPGTDMTRIDALLSVNPRLNKDALVKAQADAAVQDQNRFRISIPEILHTIAEYQTEMHGDAIEELPSILRYQLVGAMVRTLGTEARNIINRFNAGKAKLDALATYKILEAGAEELVAYGFEYETTVMRDVQDALDNSTQFKTIADIAAEFDIKIPGDKDEDQAVA